MKDWAQVKTRSLYQIFASLAYRIRESEPLISLETGLHRQNKKRRFPNDAEFKEALETRDIYDMRNRHYLLDRLENDSKERVDTSGFTIEHILPQNDELRQEWQEMLGQEFRSIQEIWQHRLGNLTLTGYNSEYSDLPFQAKKALVDKQGRQVGFDFSPLRLNKFVRDQTRWTPKEIEERGRQLAGRAVLIWSPLVVNAAAVRAAELRELRENAAKYTVDGLELDSDTQGLFRELSNQIHALGADIIQLPGENTVTYRVFDFFVEIIPRKKRLTLLLNLDFDETDDPSERASDATERAFIIHATETGGVLFRVSKAEDIAPAIHVIRQAYERVSE
jgi:predicted transport protein